MLTSDNLMRQAKAGQGDFKQVNDYGYNALMFALRINKEQEFNLSQEYWNDLIASSDLRQVNNDGWNALMFACRYNPKLIIPMLEEQKINKNLKNKAGKTGWDIAKESNPESFKIYKSYMEKQKLNKNNSIKTKNNKLVL